MLALLQRYTWCVPGAYYYDLPDVSLYDHLRTTAALAAVMAQECDAAAVMRTRSFYLQVLCEAVARWVLCQLELPFTNALYIGGGAFTLIVPPRLGPLVDELARRVNEVLFSAHHGDLGMALAYVPVAPRDLGSERLNCCPRAADSRDQKETDRIWNARI